MKKTIKAWTVYHRQLNDTSDQVFETREAARNEIRAICYRSNPLFMKKVLKNYVIIPCVITYVIPSSKVPKKTKKCPDKTGGRWEISDVKPKKRTAKK